MEDWEFELDFMRCKWCRRLDSRSDIAKAEGCRNGCNPKHFVEPGVRIVRGQHRAILSPRERVRVRWKIFKFKTLPELRQRLGARSKAET